MPPASLDQHVRHYPFVLAQLPTRCRRALDAGCGEGSLTRQLASVVDVAVGLDRSAFTLSLAAGARDREHFLLGDLLAPPFARGTFDAVVSVNALHHMDVRAGLVAMRALLCSGGVLVAVLPVRSQGVRGLLRGEGRRDTEQPRGDGPGPVCRAAGSKGQRPLLTVQQVQQIVAEVVPGARVERQQPASCSIVWVAPLGAS
jgi:SAM-dependent methyltransferase